MVYESTSTITRLRLAGAAAGFAVVAMLSLPAWAADSNIEPTTGTAHEVMPQFSAGFFSASESPESGGGGGSRIPLVLNATGNGFDFDLGGSDRRKLHIYLDSPLSLDPAGFGLESQAFSVPGRNVLGLDATLQLPFSPSLSLTGQVQRNQEQMRYQPVGSIRCTDGVLRPYSYTASGCRFIDDSYSGLDQTGLSLGARYETPSTSTAISWFTRNSEFTDGGANRLNAVAPTTALGTDLLTPVLTNPLLPGLPLRQPLSYFDGAASGVDLSFQLGVTTDGYGDLHFGVALTRVLDAEFGGLYSNLTPWGWTISDSFNTAQLNLEWSSGAFSGGIQGFYRDQVDFLNREPLDSLTTFDVHFTWRTPWNADLSLGASNILNSGADDQSASDSQSTDPFESIYGRIPYVRYKQDL